MSTHTIYGCVVADGSVEFSDSESGCDEATITGCLLSTGEHAGEVQITHDYPGCSTQYYACHDPTTGKFSVDIDDGCCREMVASGCCQYDCETVSKYCSLIFSGIEACNSGDCPSTGCWGEENGCPWDVTDCNGTWICEWFNYYGDCGWKHTEELEGDDIGCGIFHTTRVITFTLITSGNGYVTPWCTIEYDEQYFGTNPQAFRYLAGSTEYATGTDACDACSDSPEGPFSNQLTCGSKEGEWGFNGTVTVSGIT